jgi:hypothetical protein
MVRDYDLAHEDNVTPTAATPHQPRPPSSGVPSRRRSNASGSVPSPLDIRGVGSLKPVRTDSEKAVVTLEDRNALRDAQWLMSSTFDGPRVTKGDGAADRVGVHLPREVTVWCGDEAIECTCVARNRLQALPVAACAKPERDVVVITARVNPAANIEIASTHAQCVLVQLSARKNGLRTPGRTLLLTRSPLHGRSLSRSETANFVRFFYSFSTAVSHDATASSPTLAPTRSLTADMASSVASHPLPPGLKQRFMNAAQYEAAVKALGMPSATCMPGFTMLQGPGQAPVRAYPTSAGWSKLFDLFATAPKDRAAEAAKRERDAEQRDLDKVRTLMGMARSKATARDSGKRMREVSVELDCDCVARVKFAGAIPADLAEPALTEEGFLLCLAYGLAGAASDQRAINVETMAIRLRAVLSTDKVAKHFRPETPPPAPPVAAEPVSPVVEAPPVEDRAAKSNKGKKGKKGGAATNKGGKKDAAAADTASKSPKPKKAKGGKGKKGKGKKKKADAGPVEPIDLGPKPVLLERSKYPAVAPPLLPDLEFRPPGFVDEAVLRVYQDHPQSQHLQLHLHGPTAERDALLLSPRAEMKAEGEPSCPQPPPDAPPGIPFTPSRHSRPPQTSRGGSRAPSRAATGTPVAPSVPYTPSRLTANTTANMEPYAMATPRRGRISSRGEIDLAPLEQLPSLNALLVSPSAVPATQLGSRVATTSRDLTREHLEHSMQRVRNHPQYSLKGL